MTPNTIGNRIKALMYIENVKRSWLAMKLGISYNTLTKKLNGDREFIITELVELVNIFELDPKIAGELFFSKNFLLSEKTK